MSSVRIAALIAALKVILMAIPAIPVSAAPGFALPAGSAAFR